jgi:hypothetical protein
MKSYSPFSFLPLDVTLITTLVYLAVIIPLLIIHETVPAAPKNAIPYRGLNLTEAWLDLTELSKGYHPYNSRRNDEVRNWLLTRIDGILNDNGVHYTTVGRSVPAAHVVPTVASPAATVFNDMVSNFTSKAPLATIAERPLAPSTYFEGSNIVVYIRGTEDEEGEWWLPNVSAPKTHGKGGVMVNAHFDSVSTGYGATDDGMGVITALQLIRYFTTKGNTPKKGVVVLLNNGEEDGLYGAKAFLSSPMASFVHSFLNLEGAGAGGKATLFRSTDTEVTRAYAKAKHPFGSVVSADGFSLGFVRSETDYVVFRAEGYRGLDVAFWEPRSRYHTDQDDAAHSSKNSLWHMLSASVETTKYLTSDTSDEFDGPRGDEDPSKVQNGHGSDGVWFDLFGRTFAVFRLHTLFAWSVTILVVSPLTLMLITFFLLRNNKYYFFAASVKPEGDESEPIRLGGWRGAFRFPITLIVSAGLTVGAAFLLRKVNPLIIYSSQYSVWAMSISLFFSVFWFLMAGCNFIRPSALHRGYAFIWMFVFGWGLLVATTVFENRFKIGGGYMFVFYVFDIFLATLISLCELFALPTKSSIAEESHDQQEVRHGLEAVPTSDAIIAPSDENEDEDVGATETTPLVGRENGHGRTFGTTFASRYRQGITERGDTGGDDDLDEQHAFGNEQKWSAKLPTRTWLLQFLIFGPFEVIVLGQVGLVLVTATAQTATDGSPFLLPYLVVALFSILIILPLAPFMHRITHHVPSFLFLVFIGTLIYNLTAFPFSANNRHKAYFQQTIDLDTGINTVTLSGVEGYVNDIISYIPSAAGQTISCKPNPKIRSGLLFCSYEGPAPKVVDNVAEQVSPEDRYEHWVTFNVTRVYGENKARFHISGQETKACIIRWDEPFISFHVHGAASNDDKGEVANSSNQIKLWHRDWNREWVVDAEWAVSEGKQPGDEGRSGRVVCLWSDHNQPGVIPALDEVQMFMPVWTSAIKLMDGLVEGSKRFVI